MDREIIAEINEEAMMLPEEFDPAILGMCSRINLGPVVAYSTNRIIGILMDQGLSEEEAVEHYSFNIEGSYVGEYTPVYVEECGHGLAVRNSEVLL